MWLGIVAAIKSVFDVVGQVLGFVFPRMNRKQKKSDDAQTRMDEDVKKGDHDAFLDDLSDKHRP